MRERHLAHLQTLILFLKVFYFSVHGTVVTIFGKLEEELIEISFNIDAL